MSPSINKLNKFWSADRVSVQCHPQALLAFQSCTQREWESMIKLSPARYQVEPTSTSIKCSKQGWWYKSAQTRIVVSSSIRMIIHPTPFLSNTVSTKTVGMHLLSFLCRCQLQSLYFLHHHPYFEMIFYICTCYLYCEATA